MSFVSLEFLVFITALIGIYYALIPPKWRWCALLAASMAFYLLSDRAAFIYFLSMIVASYLLSRSIYNLKLKGAASSVQKGMLAAAILVTIMPTLVTKDLEYIWTSILNHESHHWIMATGMSFFMLQMIAYYVDIWRGKIEPEKNFFKYALFISFFPQIIQGPIPRYEQLHTSLMKEHRWDARGLVRGAQLVIWGFFLKLMIADKAGIVVDSVFSNYRTYMGGYVLVAGILSGFQVYTDFASCVSIAKGVSEMLGVELADNFNHPFFSISIKDFWRRWHMSLGSWLRDYIYFPLGGSRKGKVRKHINILITFLVSGIWHGAGIKYAVWGIMHGIYQVAGDMSADLQSKIYRILGFEKDSRLEMWGRRAGVFIWLIPNWIIFRADSVKQAAYMMLSVFTVRNPWIFFDDSLFTLGLEWKEWVVLALSIYVLMKVSIMQEKCVVRDRVLEQPLVVRWTLYIAAIVIIWVFGTYGFGFNAKDFIYAAF